MDDSDVLGGSFADRESDLNDKSEGDVLENNGSSSSSVDDEERGKKSKVSNNMQS